MKEKQPEFINDGQPKVQFFFENLEKEESTGLFKKPGKLTKEEKQAIEKEKKGEFGMIVEGKMGENRMLTTKEFIKEVKELGLKIDTQTKEGILVKNSNGIYVAYVSITKMYHFEINFSDFNILPEKLKSKLYRLICDYAGTPIYEREGLQKFYLKFKLGTEQSPVNFLNSDMNFDSFEPNSDYKSYNFLTQFTQEEIDEMKEKYGITLSDFEQIPVEEFERYKKEEDEEYEMTPSKDKTEDKPIGWSM